MRDSGIEDRMTKSELEEHNRTLYREIEDLEEKVVKMGGGGFDGFVEICKEFLTHYPPDIFVGGKADTDSGVEFVVNLRKAVAKIEQAEQEAYQKEHFSHEDYKAYI